MLFNFFDGRHVDQRTNRNAWFEPVTDLQRANRLGQTRDKHVVDLVLRQDAIDANAGLASIAIFRRHRAFDRSIDVRIVEDDEGCIAAELHRGALHGRCALHHQLLADFGRAREGELAHDRIGRHFTADRDASR